MKVVEVEKCETGALAIGERDVELGHQPLTLDQAGQWIDPPGRARAVELVDVNDDAADGLAVLDAGEADRAVAVGAVATKPGAPHLGARPARRDNGPRLLDDGAIVG